MCCMMLRHEKHVSVGRVRDVPAERRKAKGALRTHKSVKGCALSTSRLGCSTHAQERQSVERARYARTGA